MTQSPYPDLATIRRNFNEPALASLREALEKRYFAADYRKLDEVVVNYQTVEIPPLANLIE